MIDSNDALTLEQDPFTPEQQADGNSQSSESSTDETPTSFRIGDRELSYEEAQKALSIYDGYTQKFQSLAEERNALQADRDAFDRFQRFQELAATPEGTQALIQDLAGMHGLGFQAQQEDDGEYVDPDVRSLRAELAQERQERAKLMKSLEPVLGSYQQTQAMQHAEAQAQSVFGRAVPYAEMQAAMGATGIQDPVGAYAAFHLKQQQPIIDAVRAKNPPPVTAGGQSQKTFKMPRDMTGAELLAKLEEGLVPE